MEDSKVCPHTCERRLVAGLLVGGDDAKIAVDGNVSEPDFTSSLLGMIYRTVMELLPLIDDARRKQFLADYFRATCSEVVSRATAGAFLVELFESADTTDPTELAALAVGIREAAMRRRYADVGMDLAIFLAGKGLIAHAAVADHLFREGYAPACIKAALRIAERKGVIEHERRDKTTFWKLKEGEDENGHR